MESNIKTGENQDPQVLRDNIDAIIHHYQGNHVHCRPEARCHRDNPYLPTKTQLTDPVAVDMLQKFLHKMHIYRNAEDYVNCKDTHYVESFNNALLQYHDKRICFGLRVYTMRINLAVIDWNEHVDRPHTSERRIVDAANPRRQQPVPVLAAKTYAWRNEMWRKFMNKTYS